MIQGIKANDIRDFEKACRALNDVIERIATYKPEARIFIADGSINLMSDITLDDKPVQEQEKIVSCVDIGKMDCGSW